MSIIRCKMCGGTLEITQGVSVAVCEYCGTQQTLPRLDSDKKLTLFARANRLRLAGTQEDCTVTSTPARERK